MQFRCSKCENELEVEIAKTHWLAAVGTTTVLVQPCPDCTVDKDKAEEIAAAYYDECNGAVDEIDTVRDMLDKVHDRLGDLQQHLDRVKDKDLFEDLR